MDTFLEAARTDMDKVRGNLSEVLLAQGYQDLSGQIIRGVMKLVGRARDRARRSRAPVEDRRATRSATPFRDETRRGFGPPIPGINNGPAVSGQQDVDALLSGLGM